MPLLLLVLLGGVAVFIYLAAFHLAHTWLIPIDVRCRHCGYHGRLAPPARSFVSLVTGLLAGGGRPPPRVCAACGSTQVEEATLSEEYFLRWHFAQLDEAHLRRILEEKPAALTPIGLRYAREELDRRHRRPG
ncbi:MAG: hypothetical protein OZSIB_3171 [Candidatus Ozemobacter sibiricus]|jgi:hypothetical protein|uniref:Uncharacterized protein n=1 Tax=Candidatus Ozemobacter sibiricus TaxID=2268124 RepID=A0A367ZQL0_9BACT|nr:MAG: hypothetical protein OZSIB_3171 [Candidatus Ozemobacter sibiricus]